MKVSLSDKEREMHYQAIDYPSQESVEVRSKQVEIETPTDYMR